MMQIKIEISERFLYYLGCTRISGYLMEIVNPNGFDQDVDGVS